MVQSPLFMSYLCCKALAAAAWSETRKQQMDYLQKMAAYQLYPTGVTVREEDELLSLSTCEYSSTNGRLIVLARRIGR